MAAAAAAGELGAGDARGWLERMAVVLRDETSGICFRDLHGFTSTGSQLSWIPPPGEQAATLCHRGCNPMCLRLQPYVLEAATPRSSQLSWIPLPGEQASHLCSSAIDYLGPRDDGLYSSRMLWWQASHLFTCASDPVETSYKRFAFPADTAAATPAGGCAHRSRELWDEWRGIALRGGLEVLLKETGSGNGP